MVAARKRRTRNRRAPDPVVDVGPTPETRRKLKPDPLWLMYCAGTLDGDHLKAASYIQDAVVTIMSPVAMKFSSVAPRVQAGFMCSIERWHAAIVNKADLIDDYNLWIDKMHAYRRPIGMILSIAVDRMSCRDVAKVWHIRPSTVTESLVWSLDLFCVLKGWKGRAAA